MPKPTSRIKALTSRVRVVMAERGVRSLSDLVRRLDAIGVSISVQQLGRLIDGKAKLWNQHVIEGLMTVLDCELGDLWIPSSEKKPHSQ